MQATIEPQQTWWQRLRRRSVVSGGVLCVIGSVLVTALLPAFLR